MASPTRASAMSDTPTQKGSASLPDGSTYNAIAVRSNDWAAVLEFINAQDIVLNAAVPSHLYPLQADAKKRLKALKSTIDKYKHADDLMEVDVELDGGAQQKTSVSIKALSSKKELGEAIRVNKIVKNEKPVKAKMGGASKLETQEAGNEVVDGTHDEQAGQQSKTAIEKEVKHAEASGASTEKKSTPSAAKSATRSSQKATAPESNANKPTAASQDVTTKFFEDASRGAASKIKQKPARPPTTSKDSRSSMASTLSKETATINGKATPATQKTAASKAPVDEPTDLASTTAQAVKPSRPNMFKDLLGQAKATVVQSKRPTQVEMARAREPKLAARKTLKDANAPESTKSGEPKARTTIDRVVATKQTFKFNANGNRVAKGDFVRPDTPPKPAKPIQARQSYSEALSSPVHEVPTTTPTAGLDRRATLEDKTNKRKPAPVPKSKPSIDSSTPLQPTKPVIKRKTFTADGNIIVVNGKAVTTPKRQRTDEETEPTERPTKKLATKRPATKDVDDIEPKPAVEASADALVDTAKPTTAAVDSKLSQDNAEEVSQRLVAIAISQKVEKGETVTELKPSVTATNGTSRLTESQNKGESAPSSDSKASSHRSTTAYEVVTDTDEKITNDGLVATKSSSQATDNATIDAKLNMETSAVPRRSPSPNSDTSGVPEQKKGVAKVIKKAPKSRDAAKDIINDSIDDEDTKPNKKAKKAMQSSLEDFKNLHSAENLEDSDGGSDDVSSKPRTAKKAKDITSSLTEYAGVQKSRSVKSTDKDMVIKNRRSRELDNELAAITQEAIDRGLMPAGPRRTRAAARAQPTSLTPPSPLSPPVPSPPTPTSSPPSTSPPQSTSSAPLSSSTSSSLSSEGTKRKHVGSVEDGQPMKKAKIVNKDRVIAAGKSRKRSSEEKEKELLRSKKEKNWLKSKPNYGQLSRHVRPRDPEAHMSED